MSKIPDYTNLPDLHSMILDNSMNLARAQAAVIHKKQMLTRIKIIQNIARCNNMGDADIMGASLDHIVELCESLLHDYDIATSREIKEDAES
jgi:hypothetical protein